LAAIPARLWDRQRAENLLAEALTLAQELGDQKAQARISWTLMLLKRFSPEEFVEAIAYGEQSIALARQLNLREQLALTLKDIVIAYRGNGQLEEARQAAGEAALLWRELNNQPMLAEALDYVAMIALEQGDLEQARRASEEAYSLDKALDNQFGLYFSAGLLALAQRELGQVGKYLELLEEAQQRAENVGTTFVFSSSLLTKALDLASLGDIPRALEVVQQVVSLFEKSAPDMLVIPRAAMVRLYLRQGNLAAAQEIFKDTSPAPFTVYLLMLNGPQAAVGIMLAYAEMAQAQGDPARALQIVDDLIANLERIGAKRWLVEVLQLRAAVLEAQQRVEEAYTVLTQAKQLAEALPSRWRLWSILAALGDLDAGRGHAEEAEAWRAQAHVLVDVLAQTLPLDLRAKFSQTPAVQKL
jgi:tetratricopeptide (TPR) repeat protein